MDRSRYSRTPAEGTGKDAAALLIGMLSVSAALSGLITLQLYFLGFGLGVTALVVLWFFLRAPKLKAHARAETERLRALNRR
jgi:uncharacterized protein (DUF58 family)